MTDKSREILDEFVTRYKGHLYGILQSNAERSTTWKVGIGHVETEYFSQIDADDVLDLEVLFKHTGLLKRMPEIDVVYGKVEFIDEEARQVVKFDPVEGAPEDPLIH